MSQSFGSVTGALELLERRGFVMRRLCDLTFEEIAGELDLAGAASARALYSRVLTHLSERLPDLSGR